MSADTWAVDVQNPVELNRYVYAVNNPVRWGDPSGLTALFEYAMNQVQAAIQSIPSTTLLGNFTVLDFIVSILEGATGALLGYVFAVIIHEQVTQINKFKWEDLFIAVLLGAVQGAALGLLWEWFDGYTAVQATWALQIGHAMVATSVAFAGIFATGTTTWLLASIIYAIRNHERLVSYANSDQDLQTFGLNMFTALVGVGLMAIFSSVIIRVFVATSVDVFIRLGTF